MKRTRVVLCIFASALILLTFAACDGGILTKNVNANTPVPMPTLASRTQPAVARPKLIIQYCADTTGSYPRGDFQGANHLIATTLESAVTANQGGVTLYATKISHNTFDPSNTLTPAFSVPAIPSYGTPPTPVPTHAPEDPITDNATATAVAVQTGKGITDYNSTVVAIDQQVKDAQTHVSADVQRLTSWNPPLDNAGTSVLGCLQLAASRFQGQSGQKMLYIASDLGNNTDVDYTQNFVKDHALSGAIVHMIYFYSPSASAGQQTRTSWCNLLTSAGAKSVQFSDPAVQFNGNLFDLDLQAATQPCS